MKCAICGHLDPKYDASRTPGGFDNSLPGEEPTPCGQKPKEEDLRCMRCYIGYPPFKEDGVTPWWTD